jgi:hypothetical protein
MTSVPTLAPDALIKDVQDKLKARPYTPRHSDFDLAPSPQPAAYALIVGAGFSCPVVPLVKELMCESIGGYYIPDQDQTSIKRPASVLRKNSAEFWAEFNEAAREKRLTTVALDGEGLPYDATEAYQNLFAHDVANALFARKEPNPGRSWIMKRQEERAHSAGEAPRQAPQDIGRLFVRRFLQSVLDPSTMHGQGATGRNDLNPAHIYLAAVLEAQQGGHGWSTCAFSRTIFTTNFDTLLQNALQKVNVLYLVTDRPEKGVDGSDFQAEEGTLHLVYTHGSILRHNPASSVQELSDLSNRNAKAICNYLQSRDIITIGYSGWNDGLMAALRNCKGNKIYWCDIRTEPANHVAEFLTDRRDGSAYVCLGKGGADDLMRNLYRALLPEKPIAAPMERYNAWRTLVAQH